MVRAICQPVQVAIITFSSRITQIPSHPSLTVRQWIQSMNELMRSSNATPHHTFNQVCVLAATPAIRANLMKLYSLNSE